MSKGPSPGSAGVIDVEQIRVMLEAPGNPEVILEYVDEEALVAAIVFLRDVLDEHEQRTVTIALGTGVSFGFALGREVERRVAREQR